ncbi:hypothetical protein ASF99_04825 [Exiguobacterium sp. Leaf187]|uniref:phage scaffolding protein n=1 Tax=Exiguobacterium sp. Leaf187 TaxID=1736294 RepID=UPI0006FE2D2E|nr:hypothetical protein [Exiguobacterium sp. Leaf187]KQS19213.1 hypothetical protein ASF99_04825 [Exiguobacterium sp. Leaf187]
METAKPLKPTYRLKLPIQFFADDPPADPPNDPPNDPPADPLVDPPNDPPNDPPLDEKDKLIEKLRRENARHRTNAKEKGDDKDKLIAVLKKELGIDENSDVAAQIKAANDKANERIINAEVKALATQMNFIDPADAKAFLDRSAIEVDDEGNVNGLQEALEAVKTAKPHLIKYSTTHPPTPPGGGNSPAPKEGYDLGKSLAERLNGKNKQ